MAVLCGRSATNSLEVGELRPLVVTETRTVAVDRVEELQSTTTPVVSIVTKQMHVEVTPVQVTQNREGLG